MELKEQLSELQDKFVQVTNESASREDQRLTALATIEKLQLSLDEMVCYRNSRIIFLFNFYFFRFLVKILQNH